MKYFFIDGKWYECNENIVPKSFDWCVQQESFGRRFVRNIPSSNIANCYVIVSTDDIELSDYVLMQDTNYFVLRNLNVLVDAKISKPQKRDWYFCYVEGKKLPLMFNVLNSFFVAVDGKTYNPQETEIFWVDF